jgi:toxin ParE1/3/4
MKLRISALADSDLDRIYVQGIERFGEAAADEYLNEIRSKFALLLAFPLSNMLRDDIRPPVRLQYHKGHVIIYCADEEYVSIVRVFSRFQNWQTET